MTEIRGQITDERDLRTGVIDFRFWEAEGRVDIFSAGPKAQD